MATIGTVLVVAAGDGSIIADVPPHDMVIAADSGLDLALELGLEVDLVVGDMDSVNPQSLNDAADRGVAIIRHPVDKDETDLELALLIAIDAEPARIHMVGGGGGRVDHALANLKVIASSRWAAAQVSASVGESHLWVVRDHCELPLDVGDPVSVIAVGGTATSVTSVGLRWELSDADIDPYSARGVSNEVRSTPVKLTVGGGVVLAISSPTPSIDRGAARG